MSNLGTLKVADVAAPLKGVDDGSGNVDFELVTEDDMIAALILRGYTTAFGEIHTDPQWGADLRRLKSEPVTRLNELDVLRRAKRFVNGLDAVDEAAVEVTQQQEGVWVIDTQVRTNGRSFNIPEVKIG